MKFILRWLLNGLALWLVAYFLEGITLAGVQATLVAALLWGLFNALLRPVLKLLTLPINMMTLGLFGLVINGFLFWLAQELVSGFVVENFFWALGGAVLTAIIASILTTVLGVKKKR